ncbi:MAG TPA: metalloregulator ArsR/SmtB family transcription factor [Hyphomicrobiaceae bacterium]|nr:metalloregulator ArsR/SmtB family transcription factor [Hyphomicrobiaceae bacterium]
MSPPPGELTGATAAPVFAALGDETRLKLLARLCQGEPLSIAQLTEGTRLTRQGVTKHLGILARARIVVSQRIGRESRYTVRPEALDAAGDYLSRASRQWDETVGRLRKLVEE